MARSALFRPRLPKPSRVLGRAEFYPAAGRPRLASPRLVIRDADPHEVMLTRMR